VNSATFPHTLLCIKSLPNYFKRKLHDSARARGNLVERVATDDNGSSSDEPWRRRTTSDEQNAAATIELSDLCPLAAVERRRRAHRIRWCRIGRYGISGSRWCSGHTV